MFFSRIGNTLKPEALLGKPVFKLPFSHTPGKCCNNQVSGYAGLRFFQFLLLKLHHFVWLVNTYWRRDLNPSVHQGSSLATGIQSILFAKINHQFLFFNYYYYYFLPKMLWLLFVVLRPCEIWILPDVLSFPYWFSTFYNLIKGVSWSIRSTLCLLATYYSDHSILFGTEAGWAFSQICLLESRIMAKPSNKLLLKNSQFSFLCFYLFFLSA